MEELDFYDNKIKTVGDALNTMSNLSLVIITVATQDYRHANRVISVLDLSFNLLRAVPETMAHLKSLDTVYFVQNRISRISGLEFVGATLRSLELGGNKIRVCPLTNFRCIFTHGLPENRKLGRTGQPRRALARKEQDHQT